MTNDNKSDTQISMYGVASDLETLHAARRAADFNVFFARLTSASTEGGYTDPLKWAAEHGVAEQSIRNLRTEQKPPGLVILKRLSRASGKSINWWLGADAEFNTDEFVFIPRYRENADAEHVTMAFRRYWVEKYLHATTDQLTVYRIEDDAMVGTFNQADNVLINSKPVDVIRDGLYALIINGAMVVRRIQALPNNIIRVMPDNPKYPSFEVELTEDCGVEIVGVPVWYSRQI